METTKKVITPGMGYKWEPTDTFTLDGKEFAVIFNTLDKVVNSQKFQDKINEANDIMGIFSVYQLAKSKLEDALNADIVKEINPNVPQSNTPSEAILESQEKGN